MAVESVAGRANQKLRTRNAIVQAAAELSRTGREVTMPEVARAAMVSEATAYRYFPDLASLLQEAIAGQLPVRLDPAVPVVAAVDGLEVAPQSHVHVEPRPGHLQHRGSLVPV